MFLYISMQFQSGLPGSGYLRNRARPVAVLDPAPIL